MKFKIKWRYGTYLVDLKTKLYLERIFLKLKIRRLLRLIKRMIILNLDKFIPTTILIIIIGIIISIVLVCDESMTIKKVLWKFKDIILTTILLPGFASILISEIKWKKDLKIQYSIYTNILIESQWFIEKISNIRTEGYMFLCEENYDRFKNILNSNLNIKNCIDLDSFSYQSNRFINNLSYQMSRSNNIIGWNEFHYKNYLDLQDEIQKMHNILGSKKMNNDLMKEYIITIANDLYVIIANYRRPWRWDIENDYKIISTLKNKAELIDGFDCTTLYMF